MLYINLIFVNFTNLTKTGFNLSQDKKSKYYATFFYFRKYLKYSVAQLNQN